MKKLNYLFLVLLFSVSAILSQNQNKIWKQLEDNYLFADLEVDVLEETIENGILFKRLYFFSHHVDDEPIKVYAVYAQPLHPKEKLPAIVSIHGGGSTAHKSKVIFLAKRGYAAISYDWTGYRRPTGKLSGKPAYKTTHWPLNIHPSTKVDENDLEHNLFFNTMFVARRAITFISEQNDVDKNKIGITGYSWGGSHTFRLNALDDRIAVAVPTYGVYKWAKKDYKKWGKYFGAIEYVKNQKAPLFYITPTNDLGDTKNFDNSQEFLKKLKVPHRQVWLANEDHGIRLAGMEAAYRFFDFYLKGAPKLPPSPTIKSSIKNNELVIDIKAKGATTADVFFSYGNTKRAVGSFWDRISATSLANESFKVNIPLAKNMDSVQIYAQGYYDNNNYELSSLRKSIKIPKSVKGNSSNTKMLYDPSQGITPFYSGWANHDMGFKKSGTIVKVRPSVVDGRLCFVQERKKEGFYPPDIPIPSIFNLHLRSLSDPRLVANNNAKLVIEFYCPSKTNIELVIVQGNKDNPKTNARQLQKYTYRKEIAANKDWQKLILNAKEFFLNPDEKKEPLNNFSEARVLKLDIFPTIKVQPEIGKIYWSN